MNELERLVELEQQIGAALLEISKRFPDIKVEQLAAVMHLTVDAIKL